MPAPDTFAETTSAAPKATPGPWVVVNGNRGPRQAAAWICTIGNNPGDPAVFSTVLDGDKFVFGDKAADAHLIAAAPDMLAALKALLPEVDAEIDQRQTSGIDEYWRGLKALSDACHAAVRKAEG